VASNVVAKWGVARSPGSTHRPCRGRSYQGGCVQHGDTGMVATAGASYYRCARKNCKSQTRGGPASTLRHQSGRWRQQLSRQSYISARWIYMPLLRLSTAQW